MNRLVEGQQSADVSAVNYNDVLDRLGINAIVSAALREKSK